MAIETEKKGTTAKLSDLNQWYAKLSEIYKKIDKTYKSTSGIPANSEARVSHINDLISGISALCTTDDKGPNVYFRYADWSNKPTERAVGNLIQEINIDGTLESLSTINAKHTVTDEVKNTTTVCSTYSTNSNNGNYGDRTNDSSDCRSHNGATCGTTPTNNTVTYSQQNKTSDKTQSVSPVNSNCSQYYLNDSKNITNSNWVTKSGNEIAKATVTNKTTTHTKHTQASNGLAQAKALTVKGPTIPYTEDDIKGIMVGAGNKTMTNTTTYNATQVIQFAVRPNLTVCSTEIGCVKYKQA